jgi:hypothetical protein
MKSPRRRTWILGSLAAIACGALAIAWRAPDLPRTERGAALTTRPAPWDDRADRTDPPRDGYIPAWKLHPPRPRGEPAPVVIPPSPSPQASAVADPAHAVDGDRPARPIPGLR